MNGEFNKDIKSLRVGGKQIAALEMKSSLRQIKKFS
jgi:hypothetical protein